MAIQKLSFTNNLKLLLLFTLMCSHLFPADAGHLLLTRVVTQPDAAESFSIYNPTNSSIDLNNYYISDAEEYYKIQTEGDMSPSSSIGGFTVQFPDFTISPGDTLHIVLNESYKEFYGDDFVADLVMFGSSDSSLTGSMGFSSNKIDEIDELIILFKWEGESNQLIKDIDYFVWSSLDGVVNVIDKTGIDSYADDTTLDNQLYFETIAEQYYAYSRIGTDEIDETQSGGNGITDNNETSENFRVSWEIIELFNLGCTDSNAPNFDALADIDDGSCFIPFIDVLNDIYDCNASSNGYCDSSPICPVVKLQGMIVDYFDVTVYGGPHAITVEDEEGFRVEATIWPSEWDIAADNTSNYLISPPFNKYLMEFQGSVFEYEGDKQILICDPEDFTVVKSFNQEGLCTEDDSASVQISPAPFVLLPSLGETLDFSYSFPKQSRVIIRIYDLSGRFITSLVDKYYSKAAICTRYEDSSAWDGRDQLGQIVAPSTYIMHIEVMNPVTGETQTDAAPIVVGVKN